VYIILVTLTLVVTEMAIRSINLSKENNKQNTTFNINRRPGYEEQYERNQQIITRINYNKPTRPVTAYHPHYLVSIPLTNIFIRKYLYKPYIRLNSALNNKPFVSIYSFYRIIDDLEINR